MVFTIRPVLSSIEFKIIVVTIFILIGLISVSVIIYGSQTEEVVDLSKAACNYSQNIGRRIFFHKCFLNKYPVYDIRYFYLINKTLKADVIGIQLNQVEFNKLCKQCYI